MCSRPPMVGKKSAGDTPPTTEKRQRYGHRAVIPPRIGSTPDPVPEGVLDVLARTSVTQLSDAVGCLYTMSPDIQLLHPAMGRIAGRAVTVKAPQGDNWAIHGGLAAATDGDVLVVDWMGYRGGCGAGEKALVPPMRRGVRGVVIDGCWRDVDEVTALGFPVAGRGVSAFSPGKNELGEVNVPVHCGGVVVEPGDVVVADADGVVCVPREHAASVAAAVVDGEPELTPEFEARLLEIGHAHNEAAIAAAAAAAARRIV